LQKSCATFDNHHLSDITDYLVVLKPSDEI